MARVEDPEIDAQAELLRRALERSPFEPYVGSMERHRRPLFEHVGDPGYSGRAAAEIIGITYRQLNYWARTDLVRPTITEHDEGGRRRQYSYGDLLELKVIKNLLDAGIRLENVRDVFAYMRETLDEEISSANLVISGATAVLVSSDGELVELVKKGQGVLNVLPLAQVKQEVDQAIRELGSVQDSESSEE